MFSTMKRRVGVISAIAVMSALVPVLTSSSVSAAPALTPVKPGNSATYSACPTGSAPAAGFSDTTSTDVDCIAMHGITQGVTATTYEPDSSIPRWQMALYLTRFATAAGTALGSGADQGFTDIGDQSAEIQTAINQIKQLGVTTGTTATTFSPNDNVTREQMAMFVERMLGKTIAGPGGEGANAAYSGKITHATLTYNYADIDAGSVTYEGHNAIAEIYHMGVPGHAKTETSFGPAGNLTRGEMATWMTNALAHTNARPAGVWIQASSPSPFGNQTVTLHVSNRDSNRQPLVGTAIDIFSDQTLANTDPFLATGACNTANTVELGNAVTECKIDVGDATTDSKGNIGGDTGTTGGTASAPYSYTYWAWTGATATSYNNLTAPANSASVSQATAATVLKLSNTIPLKNVNSATDTAFEMVKYGTTVDITGQWKTDSTALGTNVPLPSPVKIVETIVEEGDDGAGTDNAGGAVTTTVKTTVSATDATGAMPAYSVTVADPTPVGTALSAVTSRTQVTVVITADSDSNGSYETSVGTISLAFDDNPALISSVSVSEGSTRGTGLAATAGGVARTATATAWDQFGTGMAGQTMAFASATSSGSTDVTDTGQFTDAVTRTTGSTGQAVLAWTDTQTATGKMVITASTGGKSGTSTFYRLATPVNHDEVEASTTDGTAVATNFTMVGSTGVLTFDGAHSLVGGEEIIVSTPLLGGEAGGNITATASDDSFNTASAHLLAVGDVVKVTTAITSGGNGTDLGIDVNDFACVKSVAGQKLTLSETLDANGWGGTCTGTLSAVAADSDPDTGRLTVVVVPAGTYYVASVPSTTTATLSTTRTANAYGAAYSTYQRTYSDASTMDGASSNGIAKLTSGSEFDTGDMYMEIVINDAANDKLVVEHKLAANNFDYYELMYDSGDQFTVYSDIATSQTAVTLAAFETHVAAKFSALGVPLANAGDIKMLGYNNNAAGGGVSVFHLGS